MFTLIRQPRLKGHFDLQHLNTNQLMIHDAYSATLLSSSSHAKVLRRIAQTGHSTSELMDHFSQELPPFQVMQVLSDLESEGYITETEIGVNYLQSGFWEALGMNMAKLEHRLRDKAISIEALGNVNGLLFRQTAESMGLCFTGKTALVIVLTDKLDRPEISVLNSQFLRQQQPWMLIQTAGVEPVIGPILIPGKTACWECMKHRLDLQQPQKQFIQAIDRIDIPQKMLQHSLITIPVYHLAILEVIKWLYASDMSQIEGKLLSFDLSTLKTQSHTLTKRPQCKKCGTTQRQVAFKDLLRPLKKEKSITSYNGYRTCGAKTAFERHKHHVSPYTGIIPYLKPYGNQASGLIHNYLSGSNRALRSTSQFWLNRHMRSGNSGKGQTDDQARMSALGEAIERYCMLYHGQKTIKQKRYIDLPNALHPNTCMLFSDDQYQSRNKVNSQNHNFYSLIPKPFDKNQTFDWCEVYSLTHDRIRLLPAGLCYGQYPEINEMDRYFYPDSNGCAAGNTFEEALLQALFELVERDAVAIWWYNRIQRPSISPELTKSQYIQDTFEYYKSIGRSTHLLDLTTDLSIPIIAAVSYNQQNGSEKITFGFGAHVNLRIAAERAVTEMNQLLPLTTSPPGDPVFKNWLETAKIADHPYLLPLEKQLSTDIAQINNNECRIDRVLEYVLNQFKNAGLEAFALDLSQPDIDLPVVKTFVPGLRHFWKRTHAGRLYDIPVKLGWLDHSLSESELNPLGFFL